jgi:hypothetical protein
MMINQTLASVEVVNKLRPHSSKLTVSLGEDPQTPINNSNNQTRIELAEWEWEDTTLNLMWVFMLLIAPALESMLRQKIEIRDLDHRWKIHIATLIK